MEIRISALGSSFGSRIVFLCWDHSAQRDGVISGDNLLGVGGVVVPLHDFGSTARQLLQLLPISALTDGMRSVLRAGDGVPAHDWVILLAWGIGGAVIAARTFRWE